MTKNDFSAQRLANIAKILHRSAPKNESLHHRIETYECPIHGHQEYEAWVPGKPYCPACKREEKDRAELSAEHKRDCINFVQSIYNMLALRDPNALGSCSFENYEPETAEEKSNCKIVQRFADRFSIREDKRLLAKKNGLRDWRRENSKGLFMYGTTGNGKTHLALAAMSSIHRQGYRALYLRAPDLLMRLADYRIDKPTVSALLASVPVLILDEVGVGRTSANAVSEDRKELFCLIDSRQSEGRPTVVISNSDAAGAAVDYADARLLDRAYAESKMPVYQKRLLALYYVYRLAPRVCERRLRLPYQSFKRHHDIAMREFANDVERLEEKLDI